MVIPESTRQSANAKSLASSRTRDNRHASSIARYTKMGDTGKRVASNQIQYDTRKYAQTESYQASRRFKLVVVHLSTSALEHPRVSHLTYGRYSCLCFFLVQSLILQIQDGSSRYIYLREELTSNIDNVEIIRRVYFARYWSILCEYNSCSFDTKQYEIFVLLLVQRWIHTLVVDKSEIMFESEIMFSSVSY